MYESRPAAGNSTRRRLAIRAEVHPSLSSGGILPGKSCYIEYVSYNPKPGPTEPSKTKSPPAVPGVAPRGAKLRDRTARDGPARPARGLRPLRPRDTTRPGPGRRDVGLRRLGIQLGHQQH